MDEEIEDLQADHSALATILRSRRAISTQKMSLGARTLWTAYLQILEAVLGILDALIPMLKKRDQREKHPLANDPPN